MFALRNGEAFSNVYRRKSLLSFPQGLAYIGIQDQLLHHHRQDAHILPLFHALRHGGEWRKAVAGGSLHLGRQGAAVLPARQQPPGSVFTGLGGACVGAGLNQLSRVCSDCFGAVQTLRRDVLSASGSYNN